MSPIDEPIAFEPIPMERVWGGRRLESRLHRDLPPGTPIGESWELVDRVDAQSVVSGGPLAGSKLHELWTAQRAAIFGADCADHRSERFPILMKLLDARERLSVQVHPPAEVAPSLGGEPKTEVWYFLDCLAGAYIYAGLRRGVTREEFQAALERGEVEAELHRLPVRSGDRIFIPSGRLHAIGGGCLIVEIQQNSDTTYRVFDWNRVGLDGKPRALHVAESIASIDFSDFEPELGDRTSPIVAECPHFHVEQVAVSGEVPAGEPARFSIWTVIDGAVECGGRRFETGATFLAPALAQPLAIRSCGSRAQLLRSTLPTKARSR